MKQPKVSRLQCWNCGQSLAEVPLPLSRHEHCPRCFEALHCCRLCRHFRANETISCREDRADPPTIKENANFCDWFQPASGAWSTTGDSRSKAARSGLEALFGAADDTDQDGSDPAEASRDSDKLPTDKAEQAKSKLDSLFRKDP